MNKFIAGLFVVVVIAVFTITTTSAAGMPRCASCPGGECPEPENCLYGVATNYCGRKICAKGPGEVCRNGMFELYGICGEGLFCKCGRCMGCSLNTFECYDKTCV